MHSKTLSFASIPLFLFLFFSLSIGSLIESASAQEVSVGAQEVPAGENVVQMTEPMEGVEVTGKKPVLKFSMGVPFARENILVMLDGMDITPVLEVFPDGFSYTPIQTLAAGDHQVTVMGYTMDGTEFYKEIAFSSRHSKTFTEAFSDNEVTAVFENVLNKNDKLDLPHSKVEANLSSQSALKEKGWDVSMAGNLRYLEQSDPVSKPQKNGSNPVPVPQKKGVDLIDYLLTMGYKQEQRGLAAELGDTTIQETENTISQLARRGGKLSLSYGDFAVGGFVVRGKEVYGFDGGLGLKMDDTDHIMGLSGQAGFLSNKITFKSVYLRGGEEGTSFGTYSEDVRRKGNAYGLLGRLDFFENKLVGEYEYNYARLDSDTTDEIDYDGDKAYRAGISGVLNQFNYKAFYKYFGRYYGVIGNAFLEKDWEGVILESGANFTEHTLRATYDQHYDNVEQDPTYPILHTYRGRVDYSFLKFAPLPVTLGYERTIVDSTDEPESQLPSETHTDTFSGSVMYYMDRLSVGFLGSYSMQDDRTVDDNDSTIITYSFTPGYMWDHFSVNSSFSYTLTEYHLTQVDQDTYTVTLDLRGDLFNGNITYELVGTYDRTWATDNSVDQETFGTSGRVAYVLEKNLWGFINPSVGIKAQYNKISNWASTNDREDHTIYLFFSTSLPLSF